MRTELGDKVYAIIRQHTGAGAAIHSIQICRELRWPISRERIVRQIIKDESPLWCKDGALPVCSIPGKGFFLAETIEEVAQRYNWLHDLADEAVHTRDYFERVCRKAGINVKAVSRLLRTA